MDELALHRQQQEPPDHGGYTTFLHTDVEPGTYQGIVLNPMQQSEPSKVAIFGNAEFAWNMWESEEKANEVWNDCFLLCRSPEWRRERGF